MTCVAIRSSVFAVLLIASSGAFAMTTSLSVSLADPTTLSLGNTT